MKILYFTRDYSPHDHRFLSSLAGTEHEVFSLRLESLGRGLESRSLPPQVEQVLWVGGRESLRWRRVPGLVRDLRRVLREIKPDLIHAGPIQNAAFLAALSGFRPLVSMSWGSDLLIDADRDMWMRWVTRRTLSRTTLLVGDCRAVKDKAVSLGFPAERVSLFPWGVDLSHFAPPGQAARTAPGSLRERLGWEDAFVLLSLRSWEPIYGVGVIVQAFILAAKEIPDLRLLLLSTGSQAGSLRPLLIQSGLEERVHFGGQIGYADLPRYYHAADLYLSASHSDGSSVSLMEALASGLPVLVSDIPGNQEWVETGEQGWRFPDGNVEALAEGIRRAYQQRQDLPGMGRASRALAEERADWRRNFQRLLDAYQLACELEG